LVEEIVADIEMFKNKKQWYVDKGIPYRRGYLLYGEPGGGKTSLCMSIAAHFEKNISILNLGGKTLSDNDLQQFIAECNPNSVLIIEDIDTIFKGRERETENSLTMSGLLNALDGALSGHDRILFMTTNYKEHLDPALIRPGRADRHYYIGYADAYQARTLFSKFFPGADAEADIFAATAGAGTESMASLQEHLIKHQNDIKMAMIYPESI
jgi:chaperone BCS1